jgi:hypothetical protein
VSGPLDEVLAAHGGLERWRSVTSITAHSMFGGRLRARFPGNRMANVSVRVRPTEQHAVFDGFPSDEQRAVFDGGDVRIESRDGALVESRRDARAAFAGLSGLPRNLRLGRARCHLLRRIRMVELPLDPNPAHRRTGRRRRARFPAATR